MALVSQLLTDAFRQSNLISINGSITTTQQTEALRYFNRIVKSVYGTDAGEQLNPLPIGNSNIARPSGWPWYRLTSDGNWFVPKNTKLMLNLTQDFLLDASAAVLLDNLGMPITVGNAVVVYLHPQPDDGTRFSISDVAGDLSSCNLVVSGNGRRIENNTFITLNTDSLNRDWFYRQDLANWFKVSSLLVGDTFPFPEEFEDFFITMLALRLNPSYGSTMDPQSLEVLKRGTAQFKARYRQHIQMPSELALIKMPNSTADRYYWAQGGYFGDPGSLFNSGLGYPWGLGS